MAHKCIFKVNNGLDEYLLTFVADTLADLTNIPTNSPVGSTVICLENSKTYVLSVAKVWTEQ